MMKLIKLMAFGAIVFGTAAGGSYFARMQQQTAHESTDEHGEATATTAATDTHGAAPADVSQGHDDHAGQVEEELAVVVRPRMTTPEDIIRNAQVLKAREEKLVLRERAAEQEQLRLQLVQSDLQEEQTAIEALAEGVKTQIESANELLVQISNEKNKLDQERQRNEQQIEEFKGEQTKMDAVEQQNLKQLSTWIQGMDSDAAAQFILELANNGKMDVAVRLLSNFEEREASKILAALKNPKLMAELAEQFRTLQRPTKTATSQR
ncbi:MAG: hypothetical protein JNG89_02015 [Planctomycetaceae bacterium]|nr:hypothetical protein [Planctomycetaceae bacterium]